MRFARLLLAAGLLSALAGCMSAAEIRARDDTRCRGYGFRPGTDAFARCLQNIDLDRSADQRALLYGTGPGFGYGVGFGGFGWRRGW